MDTTTNFRTTRDDVKNLVDEAQKLFIEAAAATGKTADDLRAKGQQLLDDAVSSAQSIQAIVADRTRQLAATTDGYVHDNPWRAIAVSTAVGVLAGLALSRSTCRS